MQVFKVTPKDGSGRKRAGSGGRGNAARPLSPLCCSLVLRSMLQIAEPGGVQAWFGAGPPRAGGQFEQRRVYRAMAGAESQRLRLARLDRALIV